MGINIEHEEGKMKVSEKESFLKYSLRDDIMIISSTYTAPKIRGRGLAAELMKYAVAYAVERTLKIYPLCSYARAYMLRHKLEAMIHHPEQ